MFKLPFDWYIQPRSQGLFPGLGAGRSRVPQAREKTVGTRLWYISLDVIEYIYVIHRPGGPYWEKLCPRSRAYSRQRAQFFPIRTDQGQ